MVSLLRGCRCMLCQVPFFFIQNMEFSKDGAKEAAARGSGDEEAGLDGGDPADLK